MIEINKYLRVNPIKMGEEDKYIITCGEFMACHRVFDSEQEAEEFAKENLQTEEQIEVSCVIANMIIKGYTEILKEAKPYNNLKEMEE